jgi:hypothetical protein
MAVVIKLIHHPAQLVGVVAHEGNISHATFIHKTYSPAQVEAARRVDNAREAAKYAQAHFSKHWRGRKANASFRLVAPLLPSYDKLIFRRTSSLSRRRSPVRAPLLPPVLSIA